MGITPVYHETGGNGVVKEGFLKIKLGYRTREALAGYAFLLPSLAGFLVFFLIPFAISIYYCFTKGIGRLEFAGLKNFRDLLGSSSFILASRNTFIFNLINVPLIMLLSLLFAMLLNQKLKGLAYFRMFFILPLVVPVASVIIVWQIAFSEYGVLNGLLSSLGVASADWIKSQWAPGILSMVYIWKNCGYNIVLFMAGLGNIPAEYYETARIDGAGPFTCFRKITLPFLIPSGFFVLIISIINSFKVFREAYLLAGSYPHESIYMLQHFMNNNFYSLSYQRLTTAAFLMTVLVVVLLVVLLKVEGKFKENL